MMQQSKIMFNRERLLNASPWILATACLLLVSLLIFFGVSNFRREQQLFKNALVERSMTLTRFISSAARESIRDHYGFSDKVARWEDFMQAAISQAVEQPGVHSVVLVSEAGELLAGADQDGPVKTLAEEKRKLLRLAQLKHHESSIGFVSELLKNNHGKAVVLSSYLPPKPGRRKAAAGMRSMMRWMRGRADRFEKVGQEVERIMALQPVYLVELDSSSFASPLRRQLLQIILLLAASLLVGVGGALSLTTLRALRGSELRLGSMRIFTESVISSLPVGLIATDRKGIIQVCNSAGSEVVGKESEYLIGSQASSVLSPELWAMLNPSTSESSNEQELVVSKGGGGESGILHISRLTIRDAHDRFDGAVLLLRDITTIRRLERELRRNEKLAALGKVAAGVAHELRNPLSSIKGLAILLQSAFSTECREQQTARMLVGEVERLNRSISELLDYARPTTLDLRQQQLLPLLKKTVSLLEMDANAAGIRLQLECDIDDFELNIDADKLRQVFLNLLLNGIQSMEHGGELLVRLAQEPEGIRISFIDSGSGIREEDLPRIFDPYFTTKSDGTGLGLAMSAKIVEEHGGKILVDSQPGQRTEVSVVLPRTTEDLLSV